MLALLPAAVATAYTFLRKEINSHMFRLHFWILFLFRRFFLDVKWYYIQKYGYYKSFKAHSSTHKHTCTRIPKCHSMQSMRTRLRRKREHLLHFGYCALWHNFSFFFLRFLRLVRARLGEFYFLFLIVTHKHTLSICLLHISEFDYVPYHSRASIQCKIPGNNDNLKPNLRFTRTHTRMLFSLPCPCSNAILNHLCVLFDNNFHINDL